MTTDQIILFALLFVVFVLLVWGRWRYDLVAFSALLVAVIAGVVPLDEAFSGFGHPATVVIALVLIVSRGLSNSGVIELMARYLVDASRKLGTHIGIMSGLAIGMGVAWFSLLAGEIISGQYGIGYFTWNAYSLVEYENIVIGMLTIGGLGTTSTWLVKQASKPALRWQASER